MDGRVVQEKSTTLSKGVISHWLSVFKPAIQDYLESFFLPLSDSKAAGTCRTCQ